ncbi:ATP-binding protein [Saccharococcus sp. Marseille-Q5394]|uniref:ATP-binding protein n=1 Tax=Saccharococcus sp. Marseille-Q5394 TaxID=2972778 RepID=UPI0021CAB274|nr:AAA family ATPase [Saccharococcus sp. Marseille-Q5394]
MKIRKLVIYGFGKHENKTIDFTDGINVIYGHNEAGKTTIQQFIVQTLFGFPQKNSAQLRYEPKAGGKFGGQVHLHDEVYGNCIVERVQGKSSGDVTVYFEDGTTGGEEAVKALVRQYDRASFESIFSFSILQLQGFERMDETELSRTLLSSGTTGVDTLLRVEKKMEKEMGDLFKKSGRNPEMNVRAIELKEMEKELKSEQERMATFAPKMDRIHEIDREWQESKASYELLREQYRALELELQLSPLRERKRNLARRLDEVRKSSFPSDGIRRFEMISGRLTEMEAKKRGLEAELTAMAEKIPTYPRPEMLTEMERLLAREPEWHEWRSAVGSIRDKLTQLNVKRMRLLDRLGLDKSDELLQADVSIHQEEYLYGQLQEMSEMNQQIGYIDRQLTQLENELRDIRTDQLTLQKNSPTEAEKKRAEEWPSIRRRLAEAKAYVHMSRSSRVDGTPQLLWMLLIVAAVISIVGLIGDQWIVVGLGACLAVISALSKIGKRSDQPSPKNVEMERFINEYAGQEAEMEALIVKVQDYEQRHSLLEEAAKANERKMGVLEEEYGAIVQEKERLEQSISEFFVAYGLRKIPNPGILHEFFGMARSLQEIERELEDAARQSEEIQEKIRLRQTEVERLVPAGASESSIYEKLRSDYLSVKEEAQTFKVLTQKIEETQMQKQEAGELLSSLRSQQQDLFTEAGVETEEQYYKAYAEYQETLTLMQQIRDIESQLSVHGAVEDVSGRSEGELRVEVHELERRLADLEEIMNSFVKEKAALEVETEKLLTDDSYQRKQQLFEMKKAEFDELAKQWSVRQAVVEAIKGMMEELKEKKLPEVLNEAEKLFSELTGGTYMSLVLSENGYFHAVARDGRRYPIIELSQATKEQAYIALRLSLAAAKEKTAPFPLVMDDPFVHFDEMRFSRMLKIMERLSAKHQFIYFTCHDKIVEYWTNATIINVSDIGSAKGAMIR